MSMHKQTRATKIPQKVREAVYERDGGLCVLCHAQGVPNAHFVARSHGGLGIEQNIVTLCPACHHRFDNTAERKEIREILRAYLKSLYPDWNENELTYRKWGKV